MPRSEDVLVASSRGAETDLDDAPMSMPASSLAQPMAYRLTGLRPSSVPPLPERPLLRAVAETLLAAAHADGEICRRERRSMRKILARLSGEEKLPGWLERHIEDFDPERADLTVSLDLLRELPPEQRRYVLELVREVCDANNAFDLEEEEFLFGLVVALALGREDVADLIIHPAEGIDGPAKRLFDVVFASAALWATWPLMAAIALGVKLSAPGPVLFKQRRSGLRGEEIEVWKFRTMRVTEEGDQVRQATQDDPRVTRFGAFLRKMSLDELPQFFNVLRGDMSVVGPRPHAVSHNHQYRTQILEYMLRHKVKPGITGWAQVNGWRGETDTLDKMIQRLVHDLEYIRRYSLWLDLKIIGLTMFGKAVHANAY